MRAERGAADDEALRAVIGRAPMGATPPNDLPPRESDEDAEPPSRRNLLLLALAAVVVVALGVVAFLLLRDDAEDGTTGGTDTTEGGGPATTAADGPASTAGGSDSTASGSPAAGDVTVSGVVQLEVAAPADGGDCALLADGYRVRALDDAGETAAITPLVEARNLGDAAEGRVHCEFDYWVRISTEPAEYTFELLEGIADEGDTTVLSSQVVASELIEDGSGPRLTHSEPG